MVFLILQPGMSIYSSSRIGFSEQESAIQEFELTYSTGRIIFPGGIVFQGRSESHFLGITLRNAANSSKQGWRAGVAVYH
jgi:hypothetical protein